MKAILYKNGIEEKRGEYPRMDIQPIKNLEDGLEWKLLIEGVKPMITSLEYLERTEVDNDTSNADYPHLKQIDVVWTKIRKSDEEIIRLIKDAENNANESLVKYVGRLKVMVLYMALVHRKLNGNNISAKMQDILDKGDAYAVKLWENDTNLKSKLTALSNGLDIDINSNWANE